MRVFFAMTLMVGMSHVRGAEHAEVRSVVMEMMKLSQRNDIRMSRRANAGAIHTVVFAKQQNNIDMLEHILNEISDPMNVRYGRHLSREEVNAMTANHEGNRAITAFLDSHDVKYINEHTDSAYIKAFAPVKLWEEILEAEFYEFSHTRDPTRVFVRSLSYSLPRHLHEHVHAVYNTVQLPTSVMEGTELFEAPGASTIFGYTTPPLLNKVYNIGSNAGNNLTTQAIYGNLYQSVSPSDLLKFQEAFELPQQAIIAGAGGHVTESACSSGITDCLEASLDAEYLMAIAQGVPTQYYYWTGEDVWLDWIMTVARMEQPPAVFTISYGSYEFFMSPAYLLSFNIEAIKLGTMGTTLLAASGDDGVAGFAARILGPAFCDYLPMFPASSPYVTAVGGTMGPERDLPEVACQSSEGGQITSGGGFSFVYPLPEWQRTAVSAYLHEFLGAEGPGAQRMSMAGYPRGMRGYPDVSLLANRYIIAAQGGFYQGTSASAPVMAGMVSLVNSARRERGMSTLGWLNPALYALAPFFARDITRGENRCLAAGAPCCEQGFVAATGWDPVTGLGSIDFEKFKSTMLEVGAGQPGPLSEAWTAKGVVDSPAVVGYLSWRTAALYGAALWMLCVLVVAVTVFTYKSIFRRGYTPVA